MSRPGKTGTTSPRRPINIMPNVRACRMDSPRVVGSIMDLPGEALLRPQISLWHPRGLRLDDVDAAHPRLQNLRYHDRAVGLLVVLHNGDERARQTETGAIQGVQEAG